MPSLIKNRDDLIEQESKLDLSYVDVLEVKIKKTTAKILDYENEKKELMTSQIRQRSDIERLEEFEIPLMESNVKEAKEYL